jgi:hypothetical protein
MGFSNIMAHPSILPHLRYGYRLSCKTKTHENAWILIDLISLYGFNSKATSGSLHFENLSATVLHVYRNTRYLNHLTTALDACI